MELTLMIYFNQSILQSYQTGSGWIIDSVTDHAISMSKYNLLPGSN